jgi:hypothetical protein
MLEQLCLKALKSSDESFQKGSLNWCTLWAHKEMENIICYTKILNFKTKKKFTQDSNW